MINGVEVRLLEFTPDGVDLMYEVFYRAKGKEIMPTTTDLEKTARRHQAAAVFDRLLFDYTQIPEMVNFVWWLEGVPRSFLDQAVRHRKTSIFARSQRVTRCENFFSDYAYSDTPAVRDNPRAATVYAEAMAGIQDDYRELLKLGVPQEDARGILPLHLHTGFAWGTSLRDLVDIFRVRTCALLQQTYWKPVALQMRQQLKFVEPLYDKLFLPPCKRGQGCVSTHDCDLRYEALVDGNADLHPCKIWADKFATEHQRVVTYNRVEGGLVEWAEGSCDHS